MFESVYDALEADDTAELDRFLDEDPGLLDRVVSPPERTLLHYAAYESRVKIVRHLVQRGVPVDVSPGGATPLHIAAIWGDPPTVETLLELGADIDARSANNPSLSLLRDGTPLALSLWHRDGSLDPDPDYMPQWLLDHGAKLDLHSAIRLGRAETAIQMLNADPDVLKKCPRPESILDGLLRERPIHGPLLMSLLEHGALFKQESGSLLASAMFHGDIKLMELLFQYGADPNARFAGTPLLEGANDYPHADVIIESLRRAGAE